MCCQHWWRVWPYGSSRSPPSVAHRLTVCVPLWKGKLKTRLCEQGLCALGLWPCCRSPHAGGVTAAQPAGMVALWERWRHASNEQVVFIHEFAWISRCCLEFALSNWQPRRNGPWRHHRDPGNLSLWINCFPTMSSTDWEQKGLFAMSSYALASGVSWVSAWHVSTWCGQEWGRKCWHEHPWVFFLPKSCVLMEHGVMPYL